MKLWIFLLLSSALSPLVMAAEAPAIAPEEASAAMARAVAFFRSQVAANGTYLWQYSADLERREGEGKADNQTGWAQPPGTPSVGMALLRAYRLTGEEFLIDAVRETATGLVACQLRSGGWDYRLRFNPEERKKIAYRVEPEGQGSVDTTTLDDDTTQSSLRFLMEVDKELAFEDAAVHDAAHYALESLLKAQYPNGAWPQRFTGPPDPEKFPVKKASYPEEWSWTFPQQDYSRYYTFNDNTIGDTVETMLNAYEIYRDERYRDAALRAGDFILLAQMPEPQPAWAQQYDADMHPAWARKFEPPAVTGGESQGVMQTLLALYRRTGERRFLEPIPRAIAYLEASKLPDGQLARFYELKTNKPLYFTKQYEMTYDDSDCPTHYGFKAGSGLDGIAKAHEALANAEWKAPKLSQERAPKMSPELAATARKAADSLDERGAWVEAGKLNYHGDDDDTKQVIKSTTFANNLLALSRYIAAAKE